MAGNHPRKIAANRGRSDRETRPCGVLGRFLPRLLCFLTSGVAGCGRL
jgi:hypothetical protein